MPGGYKVLDKNGQSLAYVYGRETRADSDPGPRAHHGRGAARCQQRCEAADLTGEAEGGFIHLCPFRCHQARVGTIQSSQRVTVRANCQPPAVVVDLDQLSAAARIHH